MLRLTARQVRRPLDNQTAINDAVNRVHAADDAHLHALSVAEQGDADFLEYLQREYKKAEERIDALAGETKEGNE